MQIRISSIKSSRPCEFALALQDDCVFADFDIDDNGQIYLLRISFDGYGCCNPDWTKAPPKINAELSSKIITAIHLNDLESQDVQDTLKSYFNCCKTSIWEEALIEYDLL